MCSFCSFFKKHLNFFRRYGIILIRRNRRSVRPRRGMAKISRNEKGGGERGSIMKGRTIAAMILAAASASVATIVAIKKARDNKILNAEDEDWIEVLNESPKTDDDTEIEMESTEEGEEMPCDCTEAQPEETASRNCQKETVPGENTEAVLDPDQPVQVNLADDDEADKTL